MNTKKTLSAILLLAVILLPVFAKAQNFGKKQVSEDSFQKWNPMDMTGKGNNKINGVTFYSFNGHCNGEDVTFIKIINSNKQAVKIEYQLTAESPKEYIRVAPSSEIEGSCAAINKDVNYKNLVVKLPVTKTEEETKAFVDFWRSHVVVSMQ